MILLQTPSYRSGTLAWVLALLCMSASFCFVVLSSSNYEGLLSRPSGDTKRGGSQEDRPLVTYAYFQNDKARANLEFFLRHGIHDDADYVFILIGENDAEQIIPTERPNVRVVHRENECFDLGSHGATLAQDGLWKKYRRFITLNDSIRGPFVPYWSKSKWTDLFLNQVTETNKLVGMTFNCKPSPHVQSMIWATDSVGMALLMDPTKSEGPEGKHRGLGHCYEDRRRAVLGEVGTTQLIRENGYTVSALEAAFHATRYFVEECGGNGADDPNLNGGYFGLTLHPYDAVFVKANRNTYPQQLAMYTEWHDGRVRAALKEEEKAMAKAAGEEATAAVKKGRRKGKEGKGEERGGEKGEEKGEEMGEEKGEEKGDPVVAGRSIRRRARGVSSTE